MNEEGGLFSGRNLLIIAVAAAVAYFLFFRKKGSSTTAGDPASGGGTATQTTGDTNIQKGAITITVSDNTTAQKGKGDDGSPPDDGTGGNTFPKPVPAQPDDFDPGDNPQPQPPTRPFTRTDASLNGMPVPTSGGAPSQPVSNATYSRAALAGMNAGRQPVTKHPPVRKAAPPRRPAPKRKPVRRRAPVRAAGTFGKGR